MSDRTDDSGVVGDADVLVARALAQAVIEGGRSLAREPRRVHGMVNDVLGAQSRTRRAEVDAVVLAAEESIPEDILAGRVDDATAMDRLRARGLDDAVSAFAVDVWRYALGMLGADSEPPSLRTGANATSEPAITDSAPATITDHASVPDAVPTAAAPVLTPVDVPQAATVTFTESGASGNGTSRRAWWLVGSAAALVLLLVAVLVIVNGGGGDGEGDVAAASTTAPASTTSSPTTTVPSGPSVGFYPEQTSVGELVRTWQGDGDVFVGALSIHNSGDEVASGRVYEVLPTSIAATTSDITSVPEHVVIRESVQPAGFRRAQAAEPVGSVVIGWNLEVEPGDTVDITYRVDVGTEVTDEVLAEWTKDQAVHSTLFATERATAPTLVITTPSGTVFTSQTVEIVGTVDNAVNLSFLGNPVPVNEDGTWAMRGDLEPGSHTLKFVARNLYGVKTSASVDVVVEVPGPETTAAPRATTTTAPRTGSTGTTTPAQPTVTTTSVPASTGTTTPPTTAAPPPPAPFSVSISGPSLVTSGCRYVFTLNSSGGTPVAIAWSPNYPGMTNQVSVYYDIGVGDGFAIGVFARTADGREASGSKWVNIQPGGGCL